MRIVKGGRIPEGVNEPPHHQHEDLPPEEDFYNNTIIQLDCGHYYIVDTLFGEKYWEELFWRNLWQKLFKGGFTSMEQLRDS